MARRVKIPHSAEVKVLVSNKRQCCVCRDLRSSYEIQIHHIDGNPSNHVLGNLAVLCESHHNMANMGVQKGAVGQTKKFTPEQVRRFKAEWEKKVEAEIKIRKRGIPASQRKQLEAMYRFEISKRKNEIITSGHHQQIFDNYNFLRQLVDEEFSSGLRLRPTLLEAYRDIAMNIQLTEIDMALGLADAIRDLFAHLIGAEPTRIRSDDRKLLVRSLVALRFLGVVGVASWGDQQSTVLKKVCDTICELADISSRYKVSNFLPVSGDLLNFLKGEYDSFESFLQPESNVKLTRREEKLRKIVLSRIDILEHAIQSIDRLSLAGRR